MTFLHKLKSTGAAGTEYALAAASAAIITIGAVHQSGDATEEVFETAAASLSAAQTTAPVLEGVAEEPAPEAEIDLRNTYRSFEERNALYEGFDAPGYETRRFALAFLDGAPQIVDILAYPDTVAGESYYSGFYPAPFPANFEHIFWGMSPAIASNAELCRAFVNGSPELDYQYDHPFMIGYDSLELLKLSGQTDSIQGDDPMDRPDLQADAYRFFDGGIEAISFADEQHADEAFLYEFACRAPQVSE